MSTSFPDKPRIAIIGAGILTVLGIFAIAIRRGPSAGPITPEELSEAAPAAAPNAPVVVVGSDEPGGADSAASTVAIITDDSAEPPVDPLTDKKVVTPAEYGVTRRKFLNRALYLVFGLFLATHVKPKELPREALLKAQRVGDRGQRLHR